MDGDSWFETTRIAPEPGHGPDPRLARDRQAVPRQVGVDERKGGAG